MSFILEEHSKFTVQLADCIFDRNEIPKAHTWRQNETERQNGKRWEFGYSIAALAKVDLKPNYF